ncbi:MAG: M20/M25/M40 family metallo-hydrolase [bacterium]|nr:M20/M25/M40 family metallo-hydrolase [bacterium]
MNTSQLLDIFMTLVSIDSPTGEENGVAQWILNRLKDTADIIKEDSYRNIYVYIKGKGEPRFFSAHMDTVEPGRNIKPIIKGEYITSDGTTILGGDNKASLACMIHTIELLHSQKNTHRPLEFIFTRSEEIGNYGAINFDYSLLKSKTGYCFDSVMPVGTIVMGSPYYERINIKLIGKEAHASQPDDGINTLTLLRHFLEFQPQGFLNKDTLFNIGIVKGGYVRNSILGDIELMGEIRSLNEKSLIRFRSLIETHVKKSIKPFNGRYTFEFVRENSGYLYTNRHVIDEIHSVEKKMRTLSIVSRETIAWGVSDANIFYEKGLTCINLGDGVENAHSKEERIKLSELEKMSELMISLSSSW